jgi:hypothetical protein
VRDVAKVLNVPVLLDPEGLEEATVKAETMVHVAYQNARIGDVFRQALSRLHLMYVVQEGYVVVTSYEKSSEAFHTRLYPVGDLAPLRAVQDPPVRDFDTLIDFITFSVDSDAWTDHGGSSTISGWPEPAALIITTTDEVHDDIEQLLARLRETDIAVFNAEQAKADQRIVERIYPLYTPRPEQAAQVVETENGPAENGKAEKKQEAVKPAKKFPTAEEVAKLIEEMLPEVSFKEPGTLLRPFHDRLIVRHRPAMLHKIEKLLEKMEAWPAQARPGGRGGGGFF